MVSEPRFWVLKGDDGGTFDTGFLQAEGMKTGDAPLCPACGEAVGMREWLPPLQVEIEARGKAGPGDLAMGPGTDFLVSERLADALHAERLIGLTLEPVEVVKVRPRTAQERLPRYRRSSAGFGPGAIDEPRSRLRRPSPVECSECRNGDLEGIYGFRIDAATWGGEDVFRPRGLPGNIVVSERFEELLRRHGFTNAKLVPTEQFVWDPHRWGPPAEPALT